MSSKPKMFSPNRHVNAKKFVPRDRQLRQDLYKSKEWVSYRFRFLHHNPKCYACPNDSAVVDHWRAAKGDIELFESNRNHIPLCKCCHDTVTALFDRNEVPDTVGKLKWLKENREKNALTFKVKVIPYRA